MPRQRRRVLFDSGSQRLYSQGPPVCPATAAALEGVEQSKAPPAWRTGQQDIIELQVAVDDCGVLVVQVRQTLRDLGRPPQAVRICVQCLRAAAASVYESCVR